MGDPLKSHWEKHGTAFPQGVRGDHCGESLDVISYFCPKNEKCPPTVLLDSVNGSFSIAFRLDPGAARALAGLLVKAADAVEPLLHQWRAERVVAASKEGESCSSQ